MKFGGTSVEDASAIERLPAVVQQRRRKPVLEIDTAHAFVAD